MGKFWFSEKIGDDVHVYAIADNGDDFSVTARDDGVFVTVGERMAAQQATVFFTADQWEAVKAALNENK